MLVKLTQGLQGIPWARATTTLHCTPWPCPSGPRSSLYLAGNHRENTRFVSESGECNGYFLSKKNFLNQFGMWYHNICVKNNVKIHKYCLRSKWKEKKRKEFVTDLGEQSEMIKFKLLWSLF